MITSPYRIDDDTPIDHGQLSPRSAAVRQTRCRPADHLNVYVSTTQEPSIEPLLRASETGRQGCRPVDRLGALSPYVLDWGEVVSEKGVELVDGVKGVYHP